MDTITTRHALGRSAEVVWQELLDQLERQLDDAELFLESLTAETVGPWQAPVPAMPLPPHLVARAEALLARQSRVLEQIPGLMEENRLRLRTTGRFRRASRRVEVSPVYVDVSA